MHEREGAQPDNMLRVGVLSKVALKTGGTHMTSVLGPNAFHQ